MVVLKTIPTFRPGAVKGCILPRYMGMRPSMPMGPEESEELGAAVVGTMSASAVTGTVKLWTPAGATHRNPPDALLV
jgi:hypothetical protein